MGVIWKRGVWPSGVGLVGCVLAFAFTAATALAQDASEPVTVEAPARVVVGETVEIRWSGEVDGRDFISIDEAGAPEAKYNQYIYPSRGMPGKLRAPEVPGSYNVRYHSGASGYPVRGASPIEVVDATAELEGPESVDAGAQVTFTWTGPANERDFISIDPAGSGGNSAGP